MATLQENLDAIKLDKDTNLLPENLKAGITCLGITGTLTQGEDLQEQLNAQDTVIQQLQEELANKTSGSPKPNVFMQEDEPTTKNGIWLKGNYPVENIIADENVFASEEWNTGKMSTLSEIPYEFKYGDGIIIGTTIYLFGSSNSNYNKYTYKYDILTDTYTKLANIPYAFTQGRVAAIGTDIYLFGGSGSYTACYKYDTLTNTYTQLTNIPYYFSVSPVVAVGTDIYLIGSSANTGVYRNFYRFDTLTNTFTSLGITSSYFCHLASGAAIGNTIYIFGVDTNTNGSYPLVCKYDVESNKFTQLPTNLPFEYMYGTSAVPVGTDIYLIGTNYTNYDGVNHHIKAYKYDTLTDTYTQLNDIPYSFANGLAVFNGLDIYLFGGDYYPNKVQLMTMTPKVYDNNSIIISQSVSKINKTKIADFGIEGAKFYYDRVYYQDENGNLLNTIPTYNGNGTEWVKISGGEG